MKNLLLVVFFIAAATTAHAQQKGTVNYLGIPAAKQEPVETERIVIKGNKYDKYTLKVTDMAGRIVLSRELKEVENALSSCELKQGFYSYRIFDGNNKMIRKGEFKVD